ncbi:MAG: DUF7090 family protein [Nitrososphaerales archaeon]
MPQEIIRTEIPLLDEFLGGGLKLGSTTAYWSEVEVESSALALQTLYNRLLQKDRGLFLTTTKKPRQILQAMKEFGFDNKAADKSQLEFIDASSPKSKASTKELSSCEKYSLTSPNDIQELLKVIEEGLAGRQPLQTTLFVFDSFSAYLDRFDDPEKVLDSIPRITKLLAKYDAIGIFVFTEWLYDCQLLDRISKCFNIIVELKATSEKPVYAMRVFSTVAPNDPGKLIFFKVTRPGGVKIYLPKIAVTGPFHAGKTSFIHSAGREAVSADRLGTTVALDYAHAEHGGFAIDLFGTPGQSRFDPLLEKLGGHAVGIIIMVSATDVRGLSRVREQFRLIKAERVPYVIVANKVNLNGAISLQAIRHLLGAPRKIPVIPMRAKNLAQVKPGEPCELDPRDVQNVLDKIVTMITKSEEVR